METFQIVGNNWMLHNNLNIYQIKVLNVIIKIVAITTIAIREEHSPED